MREHLKDLFYFSRGEKNGIIALLTILLILILAPYVSSIFTKNKPVKNTEFEKEVKLFIQSLQQIEEPEYNNRLNQYIVERYDSLNLFHFNPNSTSKENYKKLGLTEKQIKTIFNYLSKGGKFKIKDDFRKIYGIRHQQFQILKPFILLPDKKYHNFEKQKFAYDTKNIAPDSLFVFDPNKASNEELKKLGLSEKQTSTIKNFLNKGGSFKSKEDFRKIYGISNEQYNRLEPYIFISEDKIQRELIVENKYEIIELNTASKTQLTKIKGIGDYTAKAIIDYRTKIGGFVSVNQLKEIKSDQN